MRVLHVIHGLNVGGAETFIINLLNTMVESECKFDFMLRSNNSNNSILLEECKKRKMHIYITSEFPRYALKNYLEVKHILSQNQYDVIHIHANSLIYLIPIWVAKQLGIKIVLHSHSTKTNKGGIVSHIIHEVNKVLIYKYKIENVACSEKSGKWMFGRKNYTIVRNAIDTKKYQYDAFTRCQMREKNKLTNEIVIGHAGRFVDVKNHIFIIDIFYEFQKKNPNSKLYLLGDGILKKQIMKKSEQLGLQDKVIFTGNVANVRDYLMMFDFCLIPSKYEGFPFLLLEAQSTGLQCLVSDTIPLEVRLTELVKYKSIKESAENWARDIEKMIKKNINVNRKEYSTIIEQKGFGLETLKKECKKIYGLD